MVWFGFETESSCVAHELDILVSPCNAGLITEVYTCLTYGPMFYLEVKGHLHLSLQAEQLGSEDSAPGLGTVPGCVWMN